MEFSVLIWVAWVIVYALAAYVFAVGYASYDTDPANDGGWYILAAVFWPFMLAYFGLKLAFRVNGSLFGIVARHFDRIKESKGRSPKRGRVNRLPPLGAIRLCAACGSEWDMALTRCKRCGYGQFEYRERPA